MKVHGRCHCRFVEYEAEADPAKVAICHCTDCQALTGSAYRVMLPAEPGSFRLLHGEPTHYEKTAESGNRRVHAFCPRCGSPVYSTTPERSANYTLRVGALDERHQLPPRRRIWCRSALAWSTNVDGLEQRERQ